ncbi:TPA: TlpA family protein disulfide reductase [Streptococcus pyogenes]|nr:TlpA family protein disulfide reductase [Streptococcus pyogenes]HEQ8627216.1 TlpA family protein disulfide reductase [Streptococcus pyogenes]HEQ9498497.1 TlpA family protein disulfide reductase [Streptococcus pyogenes]HER0737765.1 TlpA family protein disulfide reductase [Streptococcus pyogenes]
MKKGLLVTTGLACLGLLTACSTQDNMAKKEITQDKMSMAAKKKDKMSTSKDKSMMADKSSDKKMTNDGPMAPDFELKGIDGKTYCLSEFKGKKVYLKFWASWCSICLSTLADTEDLAKMSDKDYVVLTVVSPGHQGEKSEADFKKWFQGTDYKDLPVLLDPDGKLLEAYGVRSYPTEVFIGSDGVLAKKHIGYAKKSDIKKTLKGIH